MSLYRNPGAFVTPEGGVAIRLINKTGAASVKGTVVTANSALADSFKSIVVDAPGPIGVVYDTGIPDGSMCTVIVSGIAQVYFVGNTALGQIARGFLTADGASYVIGQAMAEAYPVSPLASDKHFYEIGHVIEARTGAGLAKVVLHFN